MSGSVSPFPRELMPFCGIVGFVALVIVGFSIAAEGPPDAAPVVVLGGLAIFASNRGILAQHKGVTFSPVTLVLMAAVVVFNDAGTFSGIVIVGMASWVFLPALHRKTWLWIIFNGGITGCSTAAAGAVFALLANLASDGPPLSLLAFVPAALAFVVMNWLLLVLSYVMERGRAPREVVAEGVSQLTGDLPFAIVGFFVGTLYVSYGAPVMLLVFAPILIAREMFASYMRVKESHEETVGMLIRALEAKDKYTSGHSERVATYARYIGEELNFMPARMERLRFAALMHDIGKLVVPNQLLNKPGRLTEEEFAKVRLHEKVSVQMLSHIDFLRPVAAVTHGDNMKFIPDDDDHPIEPYIVMIADAYDAMTSTRSYRKALPQDVAFQELRDKAGIQFHPACVEALIQAIEKRNEKHGAGYEVQDEFLDAPEAGLGSAGLGDLLPSDAQ